MPTAPASLAERVLRVRRCFRQDPSPQKRAARKKTAPRRRRARRQRTRRRGAPRKPPSAEGSFVERGEEFPERRCTASFRMVQTSLGRSGSCAPVAARGARVRLRELLPTRRGADGVRTGVEFVKFFPLHAHLTVHAPERPRTARATVMSQVEVATPRSSFAAPSPDQRCAPIPVTQQRS